MLLEPERQEVMLLLAQALDGPLPPADEARLRILMAHENPAAPRLAWDRLVDAGRLMVGVWVLFDAVEAAA